MAQPVSDNAVIPVSVTLNSILRLTVVTGGNIEFVVNTLDQYSNGIVNSPVTTTNFTVASSVDFDVTLQAEDGNFIGTDNPAHTIPLDNVGYTVAKNAAGTGTAGTTWTLSSLAALTNAAVTGVNGAVGLSAGNSTQNNFDIQWELATPGLIGVTGESTLLAQNVQPDRYVTNVLIQLVGK